jgi:hypothetical protein
VISASEICDEATDLIDGYQGCGFESSSVAPPRDPDLWTAQPPTSSTYVCVLLARQSLLPRAHRYPPNDPGAQRSQSATAKPWKNICRTADLAALCYPHCPIDDQAVIGPAASKL